MVGNGFREEWFKAPSSAEFFYERFQLVKYKPQKGNGQFLYIEKIIPDLSVDKIRSMSAPGVVSGAYTVVPLRRFTSGENKRKFWPGVAVAWVGVDDVGEFKFFEYKGMRDLPEELKHFF